MKINIYCLYIIYVKCILNSKIIQKSFLQRLRKLIILRRKVQGSVVWTFTKKCPRTILARINKCRVIGFGFGFGFGQLKKYPS